MYCVAPFVILPFVWERSALISPSWGNTSREKRDCIIYEFGKFKIIRQNVERLGMFVSPIPLMAAQKLIFFFFLSFKFAGYLYIRNDTEMEDGRAGRSVFVFSGQ